MNVLDFRGADFMLSEDDITCPTLLQDLLDCGTPGQAADASVEYLMGAHTVTGDVLECAAYLRGYGAWEEYDLQNHNENLQRLVWLTGCALAEGEVAYFSSYS